MCLWLCVKGQHPCSVFSLAVPPSETSSRRWATACVPPIRTRLPRHENSVPSQSPRALPNTEPHLCLPFLQFFSPRKGSCFKATQTRKPGDHTLPLSPQNLIHPIHSVDHRNEGPMVRLHSLSPLAFLLTLEHSLTLTFTRSDHDFPLSPSLVLSSSRCPLPSRVVVP